jgi:transposase
LRAKLSEGQVKSLETPDFAGDSERFLLVFKHGASPRNPPSRPRSVDRDGPCLRGQNRGSAGNDHDAEDDDIRGAVGKSAVIIAEQLSLGLGDAETDAALPPPANDDHKTKAVPGSRNKRNRNIGALPKHLPRCDVTIEPETTACPCCAGALHRIGEDVSEVLDKVPAILRALRFIRPKYACRACEGTVVQAKARPRLIESGMASTALVAWVAAAKFAWGSTLYRQAQILAGHGLNIDRQTLARWMKQAAWMAKGVYELQLAAMHEHPRLFCDETPMPVLDPGRGRTRTCQFWAHATDDRSWKGPAPPAVAYVFAGGRGKKEILTQLTGFEGVLQVDGYAAYASLAGDN